MTPGARFKWVLVPAALLLVTGCESVVTGNEGNFRFEYDADDRVFDFNKPVAVGARLDLRVIDAGDDAPIELVDASTDDPAVLDVVSFEGNGFTLEGTGDGEVLITVKGAREGGEELSDSVNMLARVPDVHRLSHTCGADGSTAYLANQPIYVPFEFERSNGQPVIGYGYYPVQSSSPEVTLDSTWQDAQWMRFDLGAAGAATITSDIDGTVLNLAVIDEAAIDGAAQPIAFVLEDIDVGDTNPFYVLPTAGGDTVCQALATYEVTSLTPDLCDVRAIATFAAPNSTEGKESGWFEIEGIAAGTCRYTVRYPLGAAGVGASTDFEYPIQP